MAVPFVAFLSSYDLLLYRAISRIGTDHPLVLSASRSAGPVRFVPYSKTPSALPFFLRMVTSEACSARHPLIVSQNGNIAGAKCLDYYLGIQYTHRR